MNMVDLVILDPDKAGMGSRFRGFFSLFWGAPIAMPAAGAARGLGPKGGKPCVRSALAPRQPRR